MNPLRRPLLPWTDAYRTLTERADRNLGRHLDAVHDDRERVQQQIEALAARLTDEEHYLPRQ